MPEPTVVGLANARRLEVNKNLVVLDLADGVVLLEVELVLGESAGCPRSALPAGRRAKGLTPGVPWFSIGVARQTLGMDIVWCCVGGAVGMKGWLLETRMSSHQRCYIWWQSIISPLPQHWASKHADRLDWPSYRVCHLGPGPPSSFPGGATPTGSPITTHPPGMSAPRGSPAALARSCNCAPQRRVSADSPAGRVHYNQVTGLPG